mgnify:FL=1
MSNEPRRVQLQEQVKLLGVRPSHFTRKKKCNDIKGLDDGMR